MSNQHIYASTSWIILSNEYNRNIHCKWIGIFSFVILPTIVNTFVLQGFARDAPLRIIRRCFHQKTILSFFDKNGEFLSKVQKRKSLLFRLTSKIRIISANPFYQCTQLMVWRIFYFLAELLKQEFAEGIDLYAIWWISQL